MHLWILPDLHIERCRWNLPELVQGAGAVLWVHGYTHTSCNYIAGITRVVCNPNGYGPLDGRIENEQFDENLVIEI